jgi:hypothetical protein
MGRLCDLLGPLVREMKTQYVYRRAYGPDAAIQQALGAPRGVPMLPGPP